MDPRLQDFRKRLKQQQLLSQSRQGITELLLDTKESVCHTGTDPIPQSIATQTNGMLPSSDNLQLGMQSPGTSIRNRPPVGGLEQDIPVRDTATESQTNNMHGGSRNEPCRILHSKVWQKDRIKDNQISASASQSGSKHLIASPHIERTSVPERGHSALVAPHLHMECDILPCDQRVPHLHDKNEVKRLCSGLSLDTKVDQTGGRESEFRRSYHEDSSDHLGQYKSRKQVGSDAEMHPGTHSAPEVVPVSHDGNVPSLATKHQRQSEQYPRQRLDFENVPEESPRTPPQRLSRVKGHDADAVGGGKVKGERLPAKLVSSSPVTSAIGQVQVNFINNVTVSTKEAREVNKNN